MQRESESPKPKSRSGQARSGVFCLTLTLLLGFRLLGADAAVPTRVEHFRSEVQPLLTKYCSDCHLDGMKKGGVAFDSFESEQALTADTLLWFKVLKNVRAGLMPPQNKPRPDPEEQARLASWIKHDAFGIDPANPDPGRVTVRRLNRIEYRNTVHDLLGIDYDTENEFPPDDTGYGFDNIGDVLTVSPMLLEKYIDAAKSVVAQAVPVTARVMPERTINGNQFQPEGITGPMKKKDATFLSYYEPKLISNTIPVPATGHYQLAFAMAAVEKHVEGKSDYNRCRLILRTDGKEILRKEYGRENGRVLTYNLEQDWTAGKHELTVELEPLTTNEPIRSLALRIDSLTIRGPADPASWPRPKNYERFFPHEAPAGKSERRLYARELLQKFAGRAFRRPVDALTADRLTELAASVYSQSGKTFESGIAYAMTAVLASPRFIFREEMTERAAAGTPFAPVDEYSLASRLSYFLWSSMPDEELTRLATAGHLREELQPQLKRMLADPRSKAFIQNFVGQWLQARDIETVVIDNRAVLAREEQPDPELERQKSRLRELRAKRQENLSAEENEEFTKLRAAVFKRSSETKVELSGEVRQAMRQETERCFEYVLRQDRSLVELLDSNYTFLNERLARYYGIPDVTGNEMRLVSLPTNSPRGGILGQGTVLAVTSNPTRTSPVKRGLFILENILGTPPPPPPPNIPPLEDAAKGIKGHDPSLRELLASHREKPLCSSCHNRMDPLGLALENFNAMGLWRDEERNQPVDPAGKLITGESFHDVRELKHLLAANHRSDFYRCVTEKLLTYALGRGLEYYDTQTVDEIVSKLEQQEGRFSSLLSGVVNSAPFQKRRTSATLKATEPARPSQERAEMKLSQ